MTAFQPAIFIAHVLGLPFDLVQAANEVQRPYNQLAFVRPCKPNNFSTRPKDACWPNHWRTS
ncbi:hypothetical protein [Pseudomonas entomophila]|uniref:hypothetical protein n=1 Tax=Pseudomonas entomophila TaxID=312306 RepID=UPI003EB84F24